MNEELQKKLQELRLIGLKFIKAGDHETADVINDAILDITTHTVVKTAKSHQEAKKDFGTHCVGIGKIKPNVWFVSSGAGQ